MRAPVAKLLDLHDSIAAEPQEKAVSLGVNNALEVHELLAGQEVCTAHRPLEEVIR